MNLTVNHIPFNWNPNDKEALKNWFNLIYKKR